MASAKDFDFTAQVIMGGGEQAEQNWKQLERHTVAEWSGDLDTTMATMTRNEPFQIMHATGLDVRGWDNVREFYRKRMQTFSGQGFFSHRWVVSDQAIVGQGYFSGAPKGTFFGVDACGKALLIPMAIWIYFEDGLIKGESAYLDGLELQRQLREGSSGNAPAPIY